MTDVPSHKYGTHLMDEIPVADAAKRCGVRHSPWMGDWFASWSPRNSNNHAEGPWDHWVDLALMILGDPMTEIVRPEVYRPDPPTQGFYSEINRGLTADELSNRFKESI